jgi:site-specific DNA-methyltransferase (adenine-specific)
VTTANRLQSFALDYRHIKTGQHSMIVHADCLEWLTRIQENSIHGIVTDPPYGVKEYDFDQIEKRENGNGGIWRIPPSFDGSNRQPLPRFTALSDKERDQLKNFFIEWASAATHALRPGGHVFIACNSFMCQLVYSALVEGGLEFRGQLIRLVRTLRGGDRPKNAEEEFPHVCSLPRGCYEPWGILRKPFLPNMKLWGLVTVVRSVMPVSLSSPYSSGLGRHHWRSLCAVLRSNSWRGHVHQRGPLVLCIAGEFRP